MGLTHTNDRLKIAKFDRYRSKRFFNKYVGRASDLAAAAAAAEATHRQRQLCRIDFHLAPRLFSPMAFGRVILGLL